MSSIKIIGIGSPFQNDQLGWLVVEMLQTDPVLHSITGNELELLCLDRPGTSLIKYFTDADRVILIDAINEAERAGSILCLQKAQLLGSANNLSSHNIGVAEAVALADKLDLCPAHLTVYGVCVDPDNNKPLDQQHIQELHDLVINDLQQLARTSVSNVMEN